MGYLSKKNTRIDLASLGTDSSGSPFFIEVLNIKMMSYEDRQQFLDLGKSISTSESKAQLESLKAILTGLILSWNLISLDDESPLQIPSQEATSLNKVPAEVLDTVFKEMAASVKAEDQTTKNSLPQSDKSSESDRLQKISTSEDTTN